MSSQMLNGVVVPSQARDAHIPSLSQPRWPVKALLVPLLLLAAVFTLAAPMKRIERTNQRGSRGNRSGHLLSVGAFALLILGLAAAAPAGAQEVTWAGMGLISVGVGKDLAGVHRDEGNLGVFMRAVRPMLVVLRQLRHGKDQQSTNAKPNQGQLKRRHLSFSSPVLDRGGNVQYPITEKVTPIPSPTSRARTLTTSDTNDPITTTVNTYLERSKKNLPSSSRRGSSPIDSTVSWWHQLVNARAGVRPGFWVVPALGAVAVLTAAPAEAEELGQTMWGATGFGTIQPELGWAIVSIGVASRSE